VRDYIMIKRDREAASYRDRLYSESFFCLTGPRHIAGAGAATEDAAAADETKTTGGDVVFCRIDGGGSTSKEDASVIGLDACACTEQLCRDTAAATVRRSFCKLRGRRGRREMFWAVS
jgi:hypothetical protein